MFRPRARRVRAAPTLPLVAVCLVALLIASAALATDRLGALEGSRRLRQLAGRIKPVRDSGSGITRDIGAIAIIEHDGSDYDAFEDDGVTPNYAARAAVAQRFFATHGDLYDFLVVFTNFEFETKEALAFHNLIRNDVRGIGVPLVDNGSAFGSPGRLKGYVDMAAVSRYTRSPLSLDPADPGFMRTLNVLAHETGHQWLAEARFRDAAGQISCDLVSGEGHWSYLLDSDASVMYGADWLARADGSYVAGRVQDTYSNVDLYLMGLLDPSKVAPFTLLRNPAVSRNGIPTEDAAVEATPETITIDQVVAAEGPRSPAHEVSPKAFRFGFVFLTRPGVEPSSEDLEAVERVRRFFMGHFFAHTRGLAVADTMLAEVPAPPTTGAPDLERAMAWLVARQLPDGRWQDSSSTALRDTSEALTALARTGHLAEAPYVRGQAWAQAASAANLDFAARRAMALAPLLDAVGRSATSAAIVAQQNADGGFGAAPGYESDAFDTALALRALSALGSAPDARVRRGLQALAAMRSAAGGWPILAGGEMSTLVTAHVLLAAQDWADTAEAPALIAGGLGALLSRQNPDRGFGESPSTPYGTALAVQVLLRSPSAPAEAVEGAIAWLHGSQSTNGSWSNTGFETALVLATLRGSVSPNLVVPADGLMLSPAAPQEGASVQVTAHVRNTGRRDAGASRARLFDGDPRLGELVAEADVPPLAPGGEATVAFEYATADRAGDHTLYVVADSRGEVAEAREDDNATPRAIHVEGLLPNLVIGPADLDVVPYPPEEGETAEIAVRVSNQGRKAAAASRLVLTDGPPRQGGRFLGQVTIPPLGIGEAVALALPWDTTGARGDHVLHALANGDFAVRESDPDDNERALAVTVTPPLPPGPDLTVAAVSLSPARLTRLPENITVEVHLRNLGREPASSTLALYDASSPTSTPAEWNVNVGPRSSARFTATIPVTEPGDRTFTAAADPHSTLPERDEDNNRASAVLRDPHDTFDVEILPEELSASSTDLVIGETLSVTALVHNRGTAPATSVPVILGHDTGAALAELARTLVTIAPAGSAPVTLAWKTSLPGNPVPLAIRADPFDLLPELSEANNTALLPIRVRDSALANLAVSGGDVSFQPDPPREGATATVSAVVRNTSPVAAGLFTVRFHRGDPDAAGALIGEATLTGLAALSSSMVSITWSPVDVRGAQGLYVIADALGNVEEYDESDNKAFRPFSVLGLPDLVLTAGDVSLEPRYPRAGEPVTIHATVHNPGGVAAGPSLLRAVEGPGGVVVVGEISVPPLPAGASVTVELPWTPATPPGERTLVVTVDVDNNLPEQDEGNNRARRSVVVQSADLFLTEGYFSPDGDGVRDETTLAYRTAGRVRVVVSNERGQRVRTLASDAEPAGLISWDGRSDDGRLLEDGVYTFRLSSSAGALLGRAPAVVDTNRRSIYDAAGTGLIATSNLSCALPDGLRGPVFMPSEDAALFLIKVASEGFPLGLVHVSLDGSYEYVAQDAWYAGARFPVSAPDYHTSSVPAEVISPDGHELLLSHEGDLYAVDLVTGARRLVRAGLAFGVWSPDGRFISGGNVVLSREGALVGELPHPGVFFGEGWVWSRDSRFLAVGNRIVRRDGTGLRTIPKPVRSPSETPLDTQWRGDGRIYTRFGICGDGCGALGTWLLDPDTDQATELEWLDDFAVQGWSPDGSKLLLNAAGSAAVVASEDGSSRLRLLPFETAVAPRGATAAYWGPRSAGQTAVCNAARDSDVFAATSLQNLTADFLPTRLPGNNGIVLRGTVSDRNLDHYQLEYARQEEPGVWHPLGPASEVPVIDDVLAVWVPPAPGSYLLRLRAEDRAGNARSRTRVVAWDRFPVIANLTQDELLISPNGDENKDRVTFNYLVMEPTRLEIRVAGPIRAESEATGPPVVTTFSREHPTIGAGAFSWDGRDASGAVLPDGRYTVFVNDIPFRVEVDATPPDIAFAEGDLRTDPVAEPLDTCGPKPTRQGVLTAERRWHVVDDHLKGWRLAAYAGNEPVYEPETDDSGQIVYDDDGVPRVRRENGHAADRRERFALVGGHDPDLVFTAEDHAGNISTVAVLSVEESLRVLDARAQPCALEATLLPPIEDDAAVRALTVSTFFRLAETIRSDEAQLTARFQYRLRSGGPWMDAPAFSGGRGLLTWEVNFIQLGLQLGTEYRGRFLTETGGRTFTSEEFLFRPCDDYLALQLLEAKPVPGTDLADYTVSLVSAVHEPLGRAQLTATTLDADGRYAGFQSTVTMDRLDPATFRKVVRAPRVSCDGVRLGLAARVFGESGREYQDNGTCARLALVVPPMCPCRLAVRQEFGFCDASPSLIGLKYSADSVFTDASLRIERGPEEAPVVMAELPLGLERGALLEASGASEGVLSLRARIVVPGDPERTCASARLEAVVDRTPPSLVLVEPVEGAQICGTPDPVTGHEIARLTILPGDPGREVALAAADFRVEQNAWRSFIPSCPGLASAVSCPSKLPTGIPSTRGWNITGLPEADLAVRLQVCDRAGNKAAAVHNVSIGREPPVLTVAGIAPPVFSPNDDGRNDETAITVRTLQTLRLTAEVRQGTETGPVLRTLAADEQFLPGVLPFVWDGRAAGGDVVADGSYVLFVSAADPCGRGSTALARLLVDNTAPTAVITRPAPSEFVRASVDVRGAAADAHFLSYELAYGPGGSPQAWTPIGSGSSEVSRMDGLLGRWDTPPAEGVYTLRLRALDAAGNEASGYVTVNVGQRVYVDRLVASPAVFSPNADGRRDTTTIEYELASPGRVTLQVRGNGGVVLRSLESGVAHEAGIQAFVWDGQMDAGAAPEGELLAWIRVDDPAGQAAPQEEAVSLVLDRTPPVVNLERPPPESIVMRSTTVRGSITDARLAGYRVEATPMGGTSIELSRGAQTRSDQELASLSALADGIYLLSVTAEDAAENRAQAAASITIDSVPPAVAFESPVNGAVLRRGTAVDIAGRASDAHLDHWTLRFGLGDNPAVQTEIARAATASSIPLASWNIAALPDGRYTLVLEAADRAGQKAEARLAVILDGRPPDAEISVPADGTAIGQETVIVGTARDASLDRWQLESAPGLPASAFQWSPIASGTADVVTATLANWSPLPPDGVHTLRLTVRDKAGLTTSRAVAVTIDTAPPATPTGLAAEVTRTGGPTAEVRLRWNPNTETDLAGYRVSRDGVELTPEMLTQPSRVDPGRPEGVHHYSVVAADQAGNLSAPAQIGVLLDLTPPVADIQRPVSNASLSGATDVRGTAFSADDFKEYRLLVGTGTSPSSWELVRRSTVPVAAGLLGSWTAAGGGPRVLALEAEDVAGNVARVARPVFVDDEPPGPPVLASVAIAPDAASLTSTWTASPSPDAAGYLVYRNGRLANATGIATGSLVAYRVPGPVYLDPALPDGRHCYRVVTMDGAENLSSPSNEICRDLDNGAPRATILQPAPGTRFEYPIRIVAGSPDLDLAIVRFQIKSPDATGWQDLALDTAEPFETTLDPAGLSFGEYEVRAVATDRGARTDADPAAINVTYGDATAPPAPSDLAVRVDGSDVRLSWSASSAPDLEGYQIYRDGALLAHVPSSEPTAFADTGAPLGRHEYGVSAIDHDRNESARRDGQALVYVLSLDFVFPIATKAAVALSGRGSHEGTVIEVLRHDAAIAGTAASEGTFVVADVPLMTGENALVARARDAEGNRSIASNELLLIHNDPPAPVTGLTAGVDGHEVDLGWNTVGDDDLFGYVVRRGGQVLTGSSPQTDASVTASDSHPGFTPAAAFDGDPNTVWLPPPDGLPAEWSAEFPAPALVDRITVHFLRLGSEQNVGYRVEARWQDRFVTLFRNTTDAHGGDHPLPSAFATSGIRIVVEQGRWIALSEVTISKRDLVPAGTTAFSDSGVADGYQRYEVAAVDRYGAEGGAAEAQATVGDVVPPAAPTGLTAVADVRDAVLSWNANIEPDLARYVLLRDGARIATTTATSYRDPALRNGGYRYSLAAVDGAGNESAESEPAFVTIDAAAILPGVPAILFPTEAGHPITLDATVTDVRGRADPGTLVSLELNGALVAVTAVEAGFVELRRAAIPDLSLEGLAVSRDGARLAFLLFDVTTTRSFIRVSDVGGGASRDIDAAGYDGARLAGFSPDGRHLAYLAFQYGSGTQHLFSIDLQTDARVRIDTGSEWTLDAAWSPDGSRMAVVTLVDGLFEMQVRELASGATTPVAVGGNPFQLLRWSPDATRIAAQTYDGSRFELRVIDASGGGMAVVPDTVAPGQVGWSSDSRRLAYTSAAGSHRRIALYDADNGTAMPITADSSDAFDPRFDPQDTWLSFRRLAASDQQTGLEALVARRIDSGEERSVVGSEPGTGFPLHEWVEGGHLAVLIGGAVKFLAPADAFFEVKAVRLAPGENVLIARATDPITGASGPDSEPAHVTVASSRFADLAIAASDLSSYPAVPAAGQTVRLSAAAHNLGVAPAEQVGLTLRLLSPSGAVVFQTGATVSQIAAGGAATVSGFWTATGPGTYLLQAVVDPTSGIVETDEGNNEASAGVWVVTSSGLALSIDSDRAAYPSQTAAQIRVRLANGGPRFDGVLRTSVEDAAGREVALLDERPAGFEFGGAADFSTSWNTGTTYAGAYRLHVRALDGMGSLVAEAQRAFSIAPDIALTAGLAPERATVAAGQPARFELRFHNRGVNAPLEGLVGRLQIVPEESPQVIFETHVSVPRLLPGALWETILIWPSAAPAGRYAAELRVLQGDATLAAAHTSFTVTAAAAGVSGTITLDPPAVLAGTGFSARISVANGGATDLSDLPIRIDVLSGSDAAIVATAGTTVSLAAGGAQASTLPFTGTGLSPGTYAVFLRAGDPPVTLDRATLRAHGLIAPPSVDSPSDGDEVATPHPTLFVNNASSTDGATLTYEFQLFADPALTQPLPGASGVAETPARTGWTVAVNLVEDRTYYWRARARDGFSASAWTSAAAFTVDARNEPPSAPVPDTPFADSRVASREPLLTVSNAHDPEMDALTYEFRVGVDGSLATIVASANGVPSGAGLTSWAVPLTLEENWIYYWSVRATDGHGFSPWSVPISFLVDTLDDAPSAPVPIAPLDGVEVATPTPELVVANASDPDSDALTYVFEVDTTPSFDSQARQVSPPIVEGGGRTQWTPAALGDNTLYYWRCYASDGHTAGPWAGGSFFVNLANDSPGVPTLLHPVDGQTVTSTTPTLRIRNTTDADRDTLTYEFEVRDANGLVVGAAAGVTEGAGETSWTLPVDLMEDGVFTWTARANDGEASGGWSPSASFLVNVLPSPPTAPARIAPPDGSTVETPRPTLIVANATSADGLPLTYTFELYLGQGTTSTLAARAEGLAEGSGTTSWTPPIDLVDGHYSWRTQAVDARQQAGPWMTTAFFDVLVDVPPGAPTGLTATPGDQRVALAWSASPERDVTGYRVYRASMPGGPYERIAVTVAPSFLDTGLINGVTVRYVITAVDPRFESPYSTEVAATPAASPPEVIAAEVRLTPAVVAGACLLAAEVDDRQDPHDRPQLTDPTRGDGEEDDACPRWLYAAIELPAGFDAAAIEPGTVRLAGVLRPDPGYGTLTDEDHDGRRELKLRFAFASLRRRLTIGANVLRITGLAAGRELRGDGKLQVTAIAADLWFTPRTLNRKSQGEPVQARLTFPAAVPACAVSLDSLRLNDTVPVQRKVSCQGRRITVKFDRAAAIAVLPMGEHVEVRVTGTNQGFAFSARDFIRVIQ